MLKTFRFLHVLLFLTLTAGISGQNNTLSPYSAYGLGDLAPRSIGYTRGMGGTGIGLALQNQINFMNPAAYTSLDSMSFIFDAGFSASRKNYKTNSSNIFRNNINFSHLGLSFPITRWFAASFGATPYSSVGYRNRTFNSYHESTGTIYNLNEGVGDINRYFIGTGFKIDQLTFGVNLSYLLGNLEYKTTVEPSDSSFSNSVGFSNSYTLKGLYLDFGAQYSTKFDNSELIVGITFEPQKTLAATGNFATVQFLGIDDSQIDTITFSSTTDKNSVKPAKIGLGASFRLNKSLIFALDYSTSDWSKFKLPGGDLINSKATLTSSNQISFGMQYIPNPSDIRRYLPHINYQIGGHLYDTYIKSNGKQIKDYGLSFGIGLPIKGNSMIRFNYEIGRRGTLENNLVRETYHVFSLSLSLYDYWFFKPRFD